MGQFLRRARELSYFDARFKRNRAEIAVLYGRRRVGKSALTYEWAKEKRHIFFFAQRLDSATQLRQFSQAIESLQTDNIPIDFSYADWEQAFLALNDLAQEERLVVIIDEYPYLAENPQVRIYSPEDML